MKITEKDIFNYVFYPGELEKDKLEFIEKFRTDFQEQIEICEASMGASSLGELESRQKLYSILNLKRDSIVIEFVKTEHRRKTSEENYKLAAASPNPIEQVITDTFINEKEKYLIKVVTSQIENKIYLFNENGTEIHNYQLILSPSGKIISQKSNSIPSVVSPADKIENIKLILRAN